VSKTALPAAQPGVFLVDLDGTVALRDETAPGRRGPFDWARVAEDLPNTSVITVIQAVAAAGHRIVYLSGRSEVCRRATSVWIAKHVGFAGEALHMRARGDHWPDEIVKRRAVRTPRQAHLLGDRRF
jgi:hypothetical protein